MKKFNNIYQAAACSHLKNQTKNTTEKTISLFVLCLFLYNAQKKCTRGHQNNFIFWLLFVEWAGEWGGIFLNMHFSNNKRSEFRNDFHIPRFEPKNTKQEEKKNNCQVSWPSVFFFFFLFCGVGRLGGIFLNIHFSNNKR